MLYTGLSLVMTPTGPTYKGVLQLKATFIDVNHILIFRLLWVCPFFDIQVRCRCKMLPVSKIMLIIITVTHIFY